MRVISKLGDSVSCLAVVEKNLCVGADAREVVARW